MILMIVMACGDDKEIVDSQTNSTETQQNEVSEEPSETEPSEEEVLPCEMSIMRVEPTHETIGHYFRDPIQVIFMGVDETATLTVKDPDGNEVLGEILMEETVMAVDLESSNPDDLEAWPRTVLHFVPESLNSNTQYSLNVSYCQQSQTETFLFTTSEYGTPILNSIENKTFPMTIQEGTWIKPTGIAPILSALVQNSMLFGVLEEREDELDVRLAVSVDNSLNQDYCFPTITDELPTFTYKNPSFEMGPANVGVVISGFFITIDNFYISGAISPDGGSWGHGIMKGIFDARDLELALELNLSEICSVVESFGSPCIPCQDGYPLCIDMEVHDLGGSLISDPLECVQYVNCHPQCSNNGCQTPDMGVCYESEQGH